jgi:signal transduction histidine kinase
VLFAEAGREALAPAFLLENDEPAALDSSPSVTRARQMLLRLAETSQQALKELRLLIYELRPLSLHKEGLLGALRSRLEMVEQRAGMRAVLQAEYAGHLPPQVESGLYGIAQEALNNVVKHAGASQVTVRLDGGPEVTELEISDNGCGFLLDPAWPGGGMGLASMRERAAALGGSLIVHSDIGRGTRILITLTHPRQASLRTGAEPEKLREVPDDGTSPERAG